jgi:hypothetical protein
MTLQSVIDRHAVIDVAAVTVQSKRDVIDVAQFVDRPKELSRRDTIPAANVAIEYDLGVLILRYRFQVLDSSLPS